MSSEEDARGSPEVRTTKVATVRLLVLLGVVALFAMMAVLVFSLTSTIRWEEEWLVGGSTVKREEYEPAGIRVLPYPYTCALEETNDQLEAMEWGKVSTVDPDSPGFEAHLILDHEAGNIMYWVFTDEDIRVRFDAYSGEIIEYLRFEISGHGNLSEGEAASLADGIANQFHPIPADASEPSAERRFLTRNLDHANIGITYFWRFEYYRWMEGDANSSDAMLVLFLEDGTLWWYSKEWWMDVKDADPEYTVTREEAMVTVIEEFGDGFQVSSCERRVVRPNGHFGDRTYYGTQPLYVWEVLLYEDGIPALIVHVHPRLESTIVGGYEWE